MKTILNKNVLKQQLRLVLAITIVLTILMAMPLSADAVVIPAWTQTSQADFASGTLYQVEVTSSPGDVKLAKNGSDYVYAFKGLSSKTFWKYSVNTGLWSLLANATYAIAAGGALVYDGNDSIYALAGGGTSYFMRYSISGGTWTALPPVTNYINAGGALTYDGGNYIYALCGGGTKTFRRFSISGNAWNTTALYNTPNNVNGGGSLAYGGGDFIYALGGGGNTYYWKYSISGDSWSSLASTPTYVSDGGALAWDGGNYLYALKGDNTVTFWRYSISGLTWAAMKDTPATPCVYGGGALTWDKDGHLYALRGNSEVDFWRYNIAPNTWDTVTSCPSAVNYGGALAYKVAPYYTSGTLTSSVFDPGYRADFQAISWNTVTPAGTSVKFQIAANNDNAIWNFVGPDGSASSYYTASGTSVWSGLDGGRYVKYKAFFSTTDTHYTPILNDVSIGYIKQILPPVAATGPASLIEETTATVNGTVTNDGQEACQYIFQYGTAPGVYTANTTWTGSVSTGNSFSAGLSGLAQGTKYYYLAQLKNSAGIGSDGELSFLTKPEAPTLFTAAVSSGSQINLSWSKGTGAVRTKVLRKTGSYPVNYSDGTPVYFDTGTSVSDVGLTAGTTYFYRAWSEVTAGSLQQWSDNNAAVSCATIAGASVTTNPATLVEESTAEMHGVLTGDGGEYCQYSFEWGTTPGVYTDNISWTGSLTTGQTFYLDLSSLSNGQKYYYRARVKNSAGIVNGGELSFLTKPEAPASFSAYTDSDTQIDLVWTKGVGIDRVKIMRKTDGYPANINDGTQVYFDSGTAYSDTGLTPDTEYFYSAWAEVTVSAAQQWSDSYKTVSMFTSLTPLVVTNNSTLVEETSATLHGSVTFDGTEPCQYRFLYGTEPGVYTMDTGWTGSVTSGQEFSFDVSGLGKGTKYYYIAQLKNNIGTTDGVEQHFLTKPDPPYNPVTLVAESNATQVTLTWTKGEGAQRTMIRRSTTGFPEDRFSGDFVYYDTGTSFVDTGLNPDTVYYYRAWSQVSGSEQWSDGWQDITVQTRLLTPPPPPPTTPPPTTGPMTVGGQVYTVDKMQMLAPWLAGFTVLLAALAAIVLNYLSGRRKNRGTGYR